MAAGGPVVTVTVDQRYQPGLLLELLALLHSRAEGIAQVTGWSLPPDLAETRAQAVDVKVPIGLLDRIEWQSQTSPWTIVAPADHLRRVFTRLHDDAVECLTEPAHRWFEPETAERMFMQVREGSRRVLAQLDESAS
jgi:hypothetical protein